MGRYPLSMSTPADHKPSQTRQPTLFKLPAEPPHEGTPHEGTPATTSRGRPRLRTANREQIVFRAAPLDALLPHDHPARTVWDVRVHRPGWLKTRGSRVSDNRNPPVLRLSDFSETLENKGSHPMNAYTRPVS